MKKFNPKDLQALRRCVDLQWHMKTGEPTINQPFYDNGDFGIIWETNDKRFYVVSIQPGGCAITHGTYAANLKGWSNAKQHYRELTK